MNRFRNKVLGGFTLTGILAVLLAGGLSSLPAQAATAAPYTVDGYGITLTDGTTFLDGGHTNIEVEGLGQVNFQFESKCIAPQADAGDRPECFQGAITRHDMAQFIGKTKIPWSAYQLPPEFCITWVQISHENPHFGADFGTKFCVTGNGGCVVDTIHHDAQYKYSKVDKGHKEYRWERDYDGEKHIEDMTYNPATGTWSSTPNADGEVPASLNPPAANSIARTGTITSTAQNPIYNLPPGTYKYYYPVGHGYWPSQTGYATSLNGASGNGWYVVETITTPDVTTYWPNAKTLDDAEWTSTDPGSPWIKVANVKKDAYDEYVYGPCPPPTNEQCTTDNVLTVTSLSQIDLSRTRSQGKSQLVDGANHVTTWNDDDNLLGGKDQRKAAGYIDVPDFPLSKTGTMAIDYTGTGLGVGGQILLDLDDDPSNNTLILDGEAGDSIGVFEPSVYGQNMWLAEIQPGLDVSGVDVPHVAGGGGSINGSIDDYLKAWPNAKGLALGYSQGSGEPGDNLLTLIQAGCVQITFGLPGNTDEETWFDVSDGTPNCATDEVPVTTTYYKRVKVWDADSQTYVWGPPEVTSVVDSTRALNPDEVKDNCDIVPIPANPGQVEQCGVLFDGFTAPTATADMDVTVVDQRVSGDGKVVITATALNGLHFTDGRVLIQWILSFSNEKCLTGLPVTGVGLGLLAVAAAFFVLGGPMVAQHRKEAGKHVL